jgi:hypothetical protein
MLRTLPMEGLIFGRHVVGRSKHIQNSGLFDPLPSGHGRESALWRSRNRFCGSWGEAWHSLATAAEVCGRE